MDNSPKVWVFLLVVLGIAGIGFLRATSPDDYDFQPPVAHRPEHAGKGGAPEAPKYADQRSPHFDPEAKIAKACVDCHGERAAAAPRGRHTEHPVGVRLPRGADIAALEAVGSQMALDGEGQRIVGCRTCHWPHNPDEDARLIAPADDGTLCKMCHKNERPSVSHHKVEGPVPAAIQSAIASIGGPAGHGLTCVSCHTAHKASSAPVLRTPQGGGSACRTCHQEQHRALGSDGHGGQACDTCHGMHDAPARPARLVQAEVPEDQPCVNCHADGGKVRQVPIEGGHPMWRPTTAAMIAAGNPEQISCHTCHQPHSSEARLLVKGSVAATCLSCHADKATVRNTDHDAAVVPVAGTDQTCLSCHDVHGRSKRPSPPQGVNPASAPCLACHDGRTEAKQPGPADHPKGLLLTVGGLPFRYGGSVPYFDAKGQRTENEGTGEIACQTCHDPHKFRHDATAGPGATEGNEQDSFLRPQNQVVEFCSVCHGADGRPQFRFFHNQKYRDETRTQP